jgi:hypothetical protein
MNAAPETETHFELPYSRWRIFLGYLAAVVVSFTLSLFLMTTSGDAVKAISEGSWPFDAYLQLLDVLQPTAFVVYAIVGVPIAAIVVGIAGIPVWQWFASRGRTSFADAALAGAIAGGIIAAVELFLLLLMIAPAIFDGFQQTPLPAFGLTPPWGAAKILLDALHTIGIGILSGLATRAVAGPARCKPRQK